MGKISNTGIEREKKYILSIGQAKELIDKALLKIGVVQWYLNECNTFGKNKNCRVRYTVDKNGKEEWIAAFKEDLKEDFTRLEEEYNIIPSEKLFQSLYSKPVAAKIRYFLFIDKSQGVEVVIDEFIKLDRPYNIDVHYLAEIETNG
ncbi:MAG: hypothetical protein ACK4MM_05510, partial [Fervidobacterium sp.]